MNLTVRSNVHFQTGRSGRKELHWGEAPPQPVIEAGNVPRVSRLMALAIRFERLVRDGVVKDYADLARLGHVTRARLTQIMNLLNLAPDIQEMILFLPRTVNGRAPISERQLRPIAADRDWSRQRILWRELLHVTSKTL
jgi:hypothetical protein